MTPRPGLSGLLLACAVWATAALLASGTLSPWPALSGDEPHYLVIAQSLWRDGDLELREDYAELRYREFLGHNALLTPHHKPGRHAPAEYSFHAPGLGIGLAPVYGVLAGADAWQFRVGVRAAMGAWAALLAIAIWLSLSRLAGGRAAYAGTAMVMFTVPILFNGPAVFPDLPAAALTAAAYEALRRAAASEQRAALRSYFLGGLLLAPLPWLHFKFLPLLAAVVVVGLAQVARPWRPALACALLAGPIVGAASHAGYTWVAFGSLSPLVLAPSSTLLARSGLLAYLSQPLDFVRTAIGLFLDQKEGLLLIAPHYGLAAAGAAWLWRERRRELAGLVLVFAAYWIPVSLSQNVGLWSPPGRWLLAGIWPVAICAGLGLMVPVTGKPLRWLRGTLLGLGVALTLLFVRMPALAFIDRAETRSLLLQYYGGPGWEVWQWFPVWFRFGEPRWIVTLVWLGAVIALLAWSWRAMLVQPATALASDPARQAPPLRRLPHRCALRGFVGAVLVVAALVLAGRTWLPVSGGETVVTRAFNGVWIHLARFPRVPAELDESGLEVRGPAPPIAMLSTRRPLRHLTVVVASDTVEPAEVCLDDTCESVQLRPEGSPLTVRPATPGRAWHGRVYYRLAVRPARSRPDFVGTVRIVELATYNPDRPTPP